MIEYFKSVNNKYTYDNDKYLKNETPLMDEDGDSINDAWCFWQEKEEKKVFFFS